MHIKITRAMLHKLLSRFSGILVEKNTNPIALKVSEGTLTLWASDSQFSVYTKGSCEEIFKPGLAFVPIGYLLNVTREMPESIMELEVKNNSLEIRVQTNGFFQMQIPLFKELEWQDPQSVDPLGSMEFSSSTLSFMINQVYFCINPDSARNYGSVAYLHKEPGDKIRLVGTDGFRLSYCQSKEKIPTPFLKEDTGLCIPKRGLLELDKMCKEAQENIRISVTREQNTLCAFIEDYELYILLSSVRYPNYKGVLPASTKGEVRVLRQPLLAMAKRVLLASDRTKAIQFIFEDLSLSLGSKTLDGSNAKEQMPLEHHLGCGGKLTVNGRFLLDILSNITTDGIILRFTDDQTPLAILADDDTKTPSDAYHVLVPIVENE